jgi:hypothetical protein
VEIRTCKVDVHWDSICNFWSNCSNAVWQPWYCQMGIMGMIACRVEVGIKVSASCQVGHWNVQQHYLFDNQGETKGQEYPGVSPIGHTMQYGSQLIDNWFIGNDGHFPPHSISESTHVFKGFIQKMAPCQNYKQKNIIWPS